MEVVNIPENVENMQSAFYRCMSLETIPEIPAEVTNMQSTFYQCYRLQGEIVINATPTTYSNCFNGAGINGTGIILKGSSTVLNELAATNASGTVTVGE